MIRVFISEYQSHKEQSQAGRILLDFVFRKYYGIELSCHEIKKGIHGKPYIENFPLHFNLSHSCGKVVLAVSESTVGVDIEAVRKIRREIGERYLGISTDDSEALIRAWTRRESYGKMIGEGFFYEKKDQPHFYREYQELGEEGRFLITVCSPGNDFPERIERISLPSESNFV